MAQFGEVAGPDDHPDRAEQEADRDRFLGPELVHPAAADPRGDEERVEHRQDREAGLGRFLPDRDLEVHAAEEEDGEPGGEDEEGE